MAILKLKNGSRQMIPQVKAVAIWMLLNGYAKPETPEQIQFMRQVEDVSLSWQTAPDEYIRDNFDDVAPRIVATWRVDRTGRPLRPDYGPDLRFAEKWGLWARGKPTKLAEDAIKSLDAPKHYRQLSLVH